MPHETNTDRTARHLQSLYVVGAGLGAAIALGNMITNADTNPSLEWVSVPVVAAYLVTLIPFFHGAMLYMDKEFRGSPPVVMIDFVALFSQTVLFFVMAEFVREPTSYAWSWIALLGVDVLWVGWLMTPFVTRRKDQAADRTFRLYLPWALINGVCIAVLIPVIAAIDWPLGPDLRVAAILAGIAVVRTIADYWFGRRVYFDVSG